METINEFNQSVVESNTPQPLNRESRFFKDVNETHDCAWNRKFLENFGGYADKYKEALDGLFELAQQNIHKMDQYAYPLMFLARHTIELRLKSIVLLLNGSISEQTNHSAKCMLGLWRCVKHKQKDRGTHSLSKLWNYFEDLYKDDKSSEQFRIAHQLVNELNRFDSKSDTFRYPIHNNGKETLIAEFVDIRNFINVFRSLDDFLEGIEEELMIGKDSID